MKKITPWGKQLQKIMSENKKKLFYKKKLVNIKTVVTVTTDYGIYG